MKKCVMLWVKFCMKVIIIVLINGIVNFSIILLNFPKTTKRNFKKDDFSTRHFSKNTPLVMP